MHALCLDQEEEEEDDDDDEEEEGEDEENEDADHDNGSGTVLKEEKFIPQIRFISRFINNLTKLFFRNILITEMHHDAQALMIFQNPGHVQHFR